MQTIRALLLQVSNSGGWIMSTNKMELIKEPWYNEFLHYIEDKSLQLFKQLALVKEIESRFLILITKKGTSMTSVKEFVEEHYPIVIEGYIEELREDNLRYCLNRVNQRDIAEDIVQDAITQLILTKTPIEQIGPWLRQVTHNLIIKYYQSKSTEKSMLSKLQYESSLLQYVNSSSSVEDLDVNLLQSVPELLNNSDYRIIQEIDSFPDLRTYAQVKEISYEAAKQISKEARHNLKVTYLKSLGWKATQEILNYTQLKAIQRYIRQLVNLSASEKMDIQKKKSVVMNYLDFLAILDGVNKVTDWGITQLGDNRYRVHLFCTTKEGTYICITNIIHVKESGRIITETSKRNLLAGVFNMPANVILPTNLGVCVLSFEQIKALCSQK